MKDNYIIYPRNVFCNQCYIHYKKYQEKTPSVEPKILKKISNELIDSDIRYNNYENYLFAVNLIYFKYKSKILIYRTRFSNSCDGKWNSIFLTGYKKHLNEILNTKVQVEKALEYFISSLKHEINDMKNTFNK
jgi:hypothetical protein